MKDIAYSLSDMISGMNVLLSDYLHDKSFSMKLVDFEEVQKPEKSALVKLKLSYEKWNFEVSFFSLLCDGGKYFWKNKEYFSPFVLIEKRDRLEGKNSEENKHLNLDDFFVIPGYFLQKAISIKNALENYDDFSTNLSKNNIPTELFEENLSALLSLNSTGVQFMQLTEKRWLKVPTLFEFSDNNPLLICSNLRKVVYHGEKTPEKFRQQHQSHLGKLDLFETPESESIGLTYYLASGAKYDANNLTIIPGKSKKVENMLSYSTKMVPYIHYSDSTRVMMGGKNLKQALRVTENEFPIVKTGTEKEIDFQEGVNAFVGYSLYYGLNFEDGIVVSKSFAKKMSVKVNEPLVIKDSIPLPIYYEIYKTKNMLVIEGKNSESSMPTRIVYTFKKNKDNKFYYDSPVLVRCVYEKKSDNWKKLKGSCCSFSYSERYPAKFSGELNENWLNITNLITCSLKDFKNGIEQDNLDDIKMSSVEISVPVEVTKPLEVGDKITGRHGNKGTISKIIPDNEMPYVLEKNEKRHLEMILSPMSVITRMNLGQLLETHCSLANIEKAEPFKNVNINELKKKLNNLSIKKDKNKPGMFTLYLNNKKKFPATVGYQYFVRLDHCVRDKLHVVSKAKVSKSTGQPLKGRSNKGGQRIGEMEFWTLFDHNALEIINLFSKTNLKTWKEKELYLNVFNYLFYEYQGKTLKSRYSNGKFLTELSKDNIDENVIPKNITKAVKKAKRFAKNDEKKLQKALLAGKNGYIRKHMLGRRTHYSGRATIVPAVDLDIDHVYLPVDFALEWISNVHISKSDRLLIQEGDMNKRKNIAEKFNEIVNQEELMVLINRQPSLHKHSIQSSYPIFWEHFAIGFPIMLCEGFGADYDGDTIAVYYPVEQEKVKHEMKQMLPRNNPFKIGNRDIVFSTGQDMTYGEYIVSNKTNGKSETQQSVNEIIMKTPVDDLPSKLLSWQKKRLKKGTESGLSVSFFEAMDISGNMEAIKDSGARGKNENFEQMSKEISLTAGKAKPFSKGLTKKWYIGLNNKNFDSILVVRGRKSMIDKKLHVANAGYFTRKLVEFLYPIKVSESDCGTNDGIVFQKSDFNVINLEKTIMGRYVKLKKTDSWTLVTEDNINNFKDSKIILRSPVKCKAKDGVCAKCCGIEPSTVNREHRVGDFVGVLAGHTIGERGTQLSMKTFQTGETDFNMDKISREFFNRNSDNYRDYLKRLATKGIKEAMGVEDVKKDDKNILDVIDVSSIHLEILFKHLDSCNIHKESEMKMFIQNPENYGLFSALSFEGFDSVLKKIVEGNTINTIFEEKSPKSFYALKPGKVKWSDENG